MGTLFKILKPAVAAFLIGCTLFSAARADEALDALYSQLALADPDGWQKVETEIRRHWAKSGSASMDLLLKRGNDALEAGDTRAAAEHFTALTDHAPEFAEGWHARARAYFGAGLFGPALEDLQRALALEPRHFDAMLGLAVILDETGSPNAALSVFRMVQAIHPHHPDIGPAITRLEAAEEGRDI